MVPCTVGQSSLDVLPSSGHTVPAEMARKHSYILSTYDLIYGSLFLYALFTGNMMGRVVECY